MWDKILTVEAMMEVAKISRDEPKEINRFFSLVKKQMGFKEVVVLATQWKSYSEEKQVKYAIVLAGEYQASRFIALMDYLSAKFLRGELV